MKSFEEKLYLLEATFEKIEENHKQLFFTKSLYETAMKHKEIRDEVLFPYIYSGIEFIILENTNDSINQKSRRITLNNWENEVKRYENDNQ